MASLLVASGKFTGGKFTGGESSWRRGEHKPKNKPLGGCDQQIEHKFVL